MPPEMGSSTVHMLQPRSSRSRQFAAGILLKNGAMGRLFRLYGAGYDRCRGGTRPLRLSLCLPGVQRRLALPPPGPFRAFSKAFPAPGASRTRRQALSSGDVAGRRTEPESPSDVGRPPVQNRFICSLVTMCPFQKNARGGDASIYKTVEKQKAALQEALETTLEVIGSRIGERFVLTVQTMKSGSAHKISYRPQSALAQARHRFHRTLGRHMRRDPQLPAGRHKRIHVVANGGPHRAMRAWRCGAGIRDSKST